MANSGSHDLSLVDVLDLEEIRRVPVGKKPFSVAVDSAGNIFVVESGDNQLSVYSSELTRIASLPAGKRPMDVQLSEDHRYAYVTSEQSNRIFVYEIDR